MQDVSTEKKEFVPNIVAFCCNWCSYAGADLAGSSRLTYPANVKIIRVPCSCRVNPMFVLKAFQQGADGVILCGCHPGDCHYVKWVSAAEGAKFAAVMNDFVKTVTDLGENKRLTDLRVKEGE